METINNSEQTSHPSIRDGVTLILKQLLTMAIVMGTAGVAIPPLYKYIVGKNENNVIIITSAVYSVILLIIFIKKKWCILSPNYMQSKPWDIFLWTALVGFGTIIPAAFLDSIIPNLPNVVADKISGIIKNDYGYFTLCIFAPFVEEMIFRGSVLKMLLRINKHKWGAIAISALIFSLMHMNPAQMPYAFIAGLFLGWLYARTGSILPGVVFHWVNNTTVFIFCRLMPQYSDSDLIQIFGDDHKHLGLAIIFSLFIMLPAIFQLHIRTKKV